MKYEYLKMEEEDVRIELTNYILDFEKHFKKYYDESARLNLQKKSKEPEEAPDFEELEKEFMKNRVPIGTSTFIFKTGKLDKDGKLDRTNI